VESINLVKSTERKLEAVVNLNRALALLYTENFILREIKMSHIIDPKRVTLQNIIY
jgi:hypothetical protein